MAIIKVAPTPITTLSKVDYVGSPKHLKIDLSSNPTINTVEIKLWVWKGNLDTPHTNNLPPDYIFKKSKVSSEDTYVLFEIGEVISSFIDPVIEVTENSTNTSGEGVFYQYEVYWYVDENSTTPVQTTTPPTRFATLGYNWDYEGESVFDYNKGSFGFTRTEVRRYYSPFIKYYDHKINLTGATTSEGMIDKILVSPTAEYVKCIQDQYLIVYLNKQGLWDVFTPTGETVVQSKVSREKYTRTYRDVLQVNQKTAHQDTQYNVNSKQTYVINTGILLEEMGELVEEILYSQKVYLVRFLGQGAGGYTADTTEITGDSTLFTADYSFSLSISDFTQIPVIVVESDFTRKTRTNDRNRISYNIKFEGAGLKINNIR